jgi:hypothetical protein
MVRLRGIGSALLALTASVGLLAAQQPHAGAPAAKLPEIPGGAVTDGVYRNPTFGFTYKIPYGWVERTAEMQADDSATAAPDRSSARVLLAVFERPPQVPGDTVNSAVVIAAESVKSYPALKTAVDYFAPLEEITKARGFKMVNEPYESSVGTRKIPREDFSKDLGKLSMRQASLVILQKQFVVSLTFLGDSQDEVEDLIQGLTFGPSEHPGHPTAPNPKK